MQHSLVFLFGTVEMSPITDMGPQDFCFAGWSDYFEGSLLMIGSGTLFERRFCVVALWEAFQIESKHFDLCTLRVPNRSPTPISKSNDFLRQSDDILAARGPHFRPIWGGPGRRRQIHIV